MSRKSRSHSEARAERLANPEVAAEYLTLAKAESDEEFLKALKNVAQARQMAKVARESGIQRETLYRSLSETGNPTLDTLSSILSVCEIDVTFTARFRAPKYSLEPKAGIDVSTLTQASRLMVAPIITAGVFYPYVDSGVLMSSPFIDPCVPKFNETSVPTKELEMVA